MPQYDAVWCSENDTFYSQQHPQRTRIYAGFRASDIVLFLLVFGEQRNLRVVVVRVGFLVVREGGFGDDSPPEFSNSHCTRLCKTTTKTKENDDVEQSKGKGGREKQHSSHGIREPETDGLETDREITRDEIRSVED